MSGVILAKLVPSIPFVALVMTPFIEQIDPKIEAAARMCGAGTLRVFGRILMLLLLPGILAASVMIPLEPSACSSRPSLLPHYRRTR